MNTLTGQLIDGEGVASLSFCPHISKLDGA